MTKWRVKVESKGMKIEREVEAASIGEHELAFLHGDLDEADPEGEEKGARDREAVILDFLRHERDLYLDEPEGNGIGRAFDKQIDRIERGIHLKEVDR